MHNIRRRSVNPSKHIDSETEELAVARGQETSVAERCLFWHDDLDRTHILEQDSSVWDIASLDLYASSRFLMISQPYQFSQEKVFNWKYGYCVKILVKTILKNVDTLKYLKENKRKLFLKNNNNYFN